MTVSNVIVKGTGASGRLENVSGGMAWPVSLLWPAGSARESVALPGNVVADLALEHVIRAMNPGGKPDRSIRGVLTQLPTDPETIGYRQEVLTDLLSHPELTTGLRGILPHLHALAEPHGAAWRGESPVMSVLRRLEELDGYVDCVDRLNATLDSARGIRSRGLISLQQGIASLARSPEVTALRAELPALRDLVGQSQSVTVGINLDPGLHPESATIVALNDFRFKGPRSMLGRLLPGASNGATCGISPMQEVGPASLRRDSQLFKDLTKLLEGATTPLAKALERYHDVQTHPLVALAEDLTFFTGAATFLARLKAVGIEVCRPEVAPADERQFEAADLVNPAFTLQMIQGDDAPRLKGELVRNDAYFGRGARILIITGPNRGGKTTYCRAVGQAQVLFQAGLYVPAARARISPVDNIWTHFPLPETDSPGAGRLDEEVRRLRAIFDGATSRSLILLNEPLTSTSERGAMAIATDIVRAFQTLGARALLVTHLHDLPRSIPELNEAGPPDAGIRSLVAQTAEGEGGVRSLFRIVPGAPAGRSHAHEIARQHGLTYEQLQSVITARKAGEPTLR